MRSCMVDVSGMSNNEQAACAWLLVPESSFFADTGSTMPRPMNSVRFAASNSSIFCDR